MDVGDDSRELIYVENIQNEYELFKDFQDESAIFEIDFKIFDKNKNPVFIKVDLEKLSYKKPYLGGFLCKASGLHYHHSYAQTDQYENKQIVKNEREAQTYQYNTRSTTMTNECGTQMEHLGLWLDPRKDKVMIPDKYFESDDWFQRRDMTVLYLQKMYRGYRARKIAKIERNEQLEKMLEKERIELAEREKEEKDNQKDIERRIHPKSNNDFMLLEKELNSWVKNETINIKSSNLSEEDKTLALQELLHKEISLLQTIEKLKISANKENKTEKIKKFLAKMSRDKKWDTYNGHKIDVTTPSTKVAERLEQIFKNLNSSTTVDIRLQNLYQFKKLMEDQYKQTNCTLIEEIITLIERETNMLQRGRPDSSLEGLRQRLNNLYLSFIEIPIFNIEAAKYQIISKEYLKDLCGKPSKKKLKNNI